MAWISVDERMPEIGVEVYVHGAYTPDDQPKPRARAVDPTGPKAEFTGPWESREWRGETAITHWWEEESNSAALS